MTTDPLLILLRLRRIAADEARRGMAEALQAEAAAADGVRAIEEAIAHETEAAGALEGGDSVVEAFGQWMRRVGQERAARLATLARAEECVQEARAVLAASRASMEATEAVIERREEARRLAALRAEQRVLDDLRLRRQ